MCIFRDRFAIKGDAEIVPHGLHALVICPFEPRQNRVAREVVGPALESDRRFDTQLRRLMENWRPGVWCENIRPELSAGKLAANIHHEVDGLAALLRTLTGKTKNNVE